MVVVMELATCCSPADRQQQTTCHSAERVPVMQCHVPDKLVI